VTFCFHISIDDRRRTFTRRRPTVYCVWTLSGIWLLSAAAEARTSTVGDSAAVNNGRRVTGANSLNAVGISLWSACTCHRLSRRGCRVNSERVVWRNVSIFSYSFTI